ncbi:unnamed protein product [Prorocentrum cordatum]|uniref:Uncharacterized protein n=1 Tax=Prorocentrum cordatum TaxID=2364126 RepID=A0ABN9TK13_9DINO|nr:unnamed protein product [Polarella glacialis]
MASHALLRSDGAAVACGNNHSGECSLPGLAAGLTYTQVAAGVAHTVLLRSDGVAVACGRNDSGQCDIPAAGDGRTYTQVAAGGSHSVLLRSDGTALACGNDYCGECDLPGAGRHLAHTQVSAGFGHTVLVRSDGTALACGSNDSGQCQFPSAPVAFQTWTEWARSKGSKPISLRYEPYSSPAKSLPTLVLQAAFDGSSICFTTLGGEKLCQVSASPSDDLTDLYSQLMAGRLAGMVGTEFSRVEVVLPGGGLLGRVTAEAARVSIFASAAACGASDRH